MTLHSVVPDDARSTLPSDAELILAVRAGDRQAYGTLYERHLAAARAHARQLTRSSADADDLVAEAFAKVFVVLQAGRGPDGAFRAYLMTTLRNGLYQRLRQDRRLDVTDDMARHDQGVPWSDPVEAELNSSLAARAFSTLPVRWQTVLWRSEVEGQSTAEIGEQLGLRPNAVAALAYRAREGLRRAYLQAHLTAHPDEACRPTVHRLGGWTRGKLPAGDAALVRRHLDDCGRCRHLATELADVNDGIRGLLAPLALAGTPAAYTSAATGAASLGVMASGVAVGATVAPGAAATAAAGGGSVIGSALGWLLGTHAGEAAAVLAAVVVGGTAVAAGPSVVGVGRQGPASATVAHVGSGQAASAAGEQPDRPGRPDMLVARQGEPSSGKQPSSNSPDGRGPSSKPSGKQPSGNPSQDPTTTPSKATASSSQDRSAAAKPAEDRSAGPVPTKPVEAGGSKRRIDGQSGGSVYGRSSTTSTGAVGTTRRRDVHSSSVTTNPVAPASTTMTPTTSRSGRTP